MPIRSDVLLDDLPDKVVAAREAWVPDARRKLVLQLGEEKPTLALILWIRSLVIS